MTLLESIIEELFITEGVSSRMINNAIDGLHPASIKYDSPSGKAGATGYRLIYPVAYGVSKGNNEVVRAFETGGATATKNPGWKFFRRDRISSWKTLPRQFNPNSSEFVGAFSEFNKDGDDSMVQVYNISPIGNAQKVKDAYSKSGKVKSGPITKQDVENAGVKSNNVTDASGRNSATDIVNDIINNIGREDTENVKNNVYNSGEKDYINKDPKINATETKPVTRSEVMNPGGQNVTTDNEGLSNNDNKKMTAGNEPITRNDVMNGGEDNESELTKQYKDMLSRMDKLNKDTDKEEEEENGNV